MTKGKIKFVYSFGGGKAEGRGNMKNLLGGKGAGLAEMTQLGIPVPPGFTITTEACLAYFHAKNQFPKGMMEEAIAALRRVEKIKGESFGDPNSPLLVSVRSGARASMPGMMDTVLNLGLNDQTVLGLIRKSKNERFGYDAYRRFVAMFGNIVMGVNKNRFDAALENCKRDAGVHLDTDIPAAALKDLVHTFKKIILEATKTPFPDDPIEQLRLGIAAVFKSWFGQRAATYRRINNLPDSWGTAVSVVAMVFGNMGEASATGVAFTRDPNIGKKVFFGEVLFNAQGEDVVAGTRTPIPIAALQKRQPTTYKELVTIYKKLEKHYKDMLDLEFTIQEGKLYLLQTRVGKRTARAAVKMAVDMAQEGLITRDEAVLRVDPLLLDHLLHPMIDSNGKVNVIAKGLPASPGAAIGHVVFFAEDAETKAALGEKVILVRSETSPEDIGGMNAAEGIVTARGGMTSHAAVVARGMGKCCITGCGALKIDEEKRIVTVEGLMIKEGDFITLNGSTGEVILGKAPLIQPTMNESFKTLMRWADAARKMKVRTNADTPKDARVGREFGAEGIGLCRTEHMFFDEGRIMAVREMILANTVTERKMALAKILPMQKNDFIGIFKEMKGLPVTIRLLDPPLHEFIPHGQEDIAALSREMNVSIDMLRSKIRSLEEFNPMLGHRGCRLGITYPEIYEMQVTAIFEAACELKKKGITAGVEIMIPLVSHTGEFTNMRALCVRVGKEVMDRYKKNIPYSVGTMIELPRAALVADKIAKDAEFFSFGTNDLTQTTFGLSRDDSSRFLPEYIEKEILPQDPFVSIDQDGVGALMEIAVEKGRMTRKNIKVGICGEHGGEPVSVAFCHRIGLNYVSCSPFRVPIARLAAAQAALKEKQAKKTGAKKEESSSV
ncbi:MAG: pyruvate, phosphate dikinase [Nitrospirota bacterium]